MLLIDEEASIDAPNFSGFTSTPTFSASGAGIQMRSSDSSLILIDSELRDNGNETDESGNFEGGGIHVSGGDVEIDRCLFIGNKSTHGSAIYQGGSELLRISNTTLSSR